MISSQAHIEEVRGASEDQLSFEAIGEEVCPDSQRVTR